MTNHKSYKGIGPPRSQFSLYTLFRKRCKAFFLYPHLDFLVSASMNISFIIPILFPLSRSKDLIHPTFKPLSRCNTKGTHRFRLRNFCIARLYLPFLHKFEFVRFSAAPTSRFSYFERKFYTGFIWSQSTGFQDFLK